MRFPRSGQGRTGRGAATFFHTPFEGSHRVPGIIRWPGNVPAGLVTQELLAVVDWLPTIAGMVGASDLVPTDRPIDGVDASAFMLGKTETSGRDSYMFFGTDGGLLSVKWKAYKIIFRYTENSPRPAMEQPYQKPQFPMCYDLSSDPHEDNNLFYSDLTNTWMLYPALKIVAEYERSVREYPNIKVGEDFTGYNR